MLANEANGVRYEYYAVALKAPILNWERRYLK